MKYNKISGSIISATPTQQFSEHSAPEALPISICGSLSYPTYFVSPLTTTELRILPQINYLSCKNLLLSLPLRLPYVKRRFLKNIPHKVEWGKLSEKCCLLIHNYLKHVVGTKQETFCLPYTVGNKYLVGPTQ
jgi:hypothetical protein